MNLSKAILSALLTVSAASTVMAGFAQTQAPASANMQIPDQVQQDQELLIALNNQFVKAYEKAEKSRKEKDILVLHETAQRMLRVIARMPKDVIKQMGINVESIAIWAVPTRAIVQDSTVEDDAIVTAGDSGFKSSLHPGGNQQGVN